MKKIMFITGSMVRGGAERVISILANDYAKNGYQVTIVMLLHSYVGYNLDSRINIIDLSDDTKSIYLRYPFLVSKLRKILKKQKPDVVVSLMWNACLIAGMAIKGLNIRFITSERIDPSQTDRNKIIKYIVEKIYANSSCCVLQTKRAYNYFPDKVKEKSIIIPNPISVSEEATYNDKRIVAAGRLTEQKNHKMLIDVFSSIFFKFPDWTLEIYGDGPLKDTLLDQINQKNLSNNIILKGNVSDIHKKIKDARLFVLSSDLEGLSNALLEAMMIGLPCISTDCAGSDEVISNMENGILIPIGDSNALKEAMIMLMDNRELAIKLGRKARQSSYCFDAPIIIKKWKEVIEG